MDKLSIFGGEPREVTLKTEENNSIDTVVGKLSGVEKELKLTRKGHEAWDWGEEVEDSDEIDLEDING